MNKDINVRKQRLKAKKAKVPEAKFSMILVTAMRVLHSYVKTEKQSNLASIKIFEGGIWVIVVNGKAANV